VRATSYRVGWVEDLVVSFVASFVVWSVMRSRATTLPCRLVAGKQRGASGRSHGFIGAASSSNLCRPFVLDERCYGGPRQRADTGMTVDSMRRSDAFDAWFVVVARRGLGGVAGARRRRQEARGG